MNGSPGAAEISAALTSSAIGAVSVVIVVVASAALTLRAAIAAPLASLAESFEHGGGTNIGLRLADAARLDAGMRKIVAEARSRERDAATERERQLRGELAAAEHALAGAEARLESLAPIAEALARLARGDLTVPGASGREAHPLQSKLDQAVAQVAKTVLAFSASLDAIRGGAEQMNASVDAYGEDISKLAARTEAALSALSKRSEATAELAAPVSASAALLRALVEDAAPRGDGVRRGRAAFGEIGLAVQRIAPILMLVDEVAFQTNMLALNAGVEAARVGDAGRGMGVVAQELRLLAGRAARAAKDSSAMLSTLRAEAERGASELSTVESAHVALPGRAQEIIASLERIGLELAEDKNRRDVLPKLPDPVAEAASARIRLKDEMTARTEALESLLGKLSALTDRFKLESDDFASSRARPAPRRAQRTEARQNSS